MICKSLDTLVRPSLDTLHELSLMFVMEFLDAFLEFYLSGSQGLNLLELLKVEESFRHWELITASRRSQKALKLCSVRQVKDELVDFSERLRIHILQLLSLKDGLHEKGSYFGNIAFLQLSLRENFGGSLLEILLEGSNQLSSPSSDELLTLFVNEGRDNIVLMKSRNLDLNSFDSVSTYEAHLSVPTLLWLGRS